MSAASTASMAANSGVPGGSSTQSGPPYLCPTCQTSYSRLEYLRRHERRHADIRPFVCDCGKGFSRSDVLSRHKRQCTVHLNGGSAEEADISVASSNGAGNTSSAADKVNGNGNSKRSSNAARSTKKSNGASGVSRSASRKGSQPGSGDRSDSLHETPDDEDASHSPAPMPHQARPYPPPQPMHQYHPMQGHPHGMPMMPQGVGNSFPFPPQPGVQQPPSAPPPMMPGAPYGPDGNPMAGNQFAMPPNAPFAGMMPPHLANFTQLVNPQHFPASPESNGTMSQHSSPRFAARDMARHGSNGSRFSLRKGGSFDHIGPRAAPPGQTPNQYAPEFWDHSIDANKVVTSMAPSDYVSAGTSQPLSLSDGTNGLPLSVTAGLNGVTTPRGEPQRFAVSTGPLSPFSSIALSSAMSPYLSAFSNARDTPFVASPSRGTIPGTPGSSLNIFDWTMRPPSKPASSSMSKRDSISQQGTAQALTAQGATMQSSASSQGGNRGSSPAATAAVNSKRKREEEEGSRKSPKLTDKATQDDDQHDEDQRSAAELLDSLRNAGSRSSQGGGSDAGNQSTSSVSSDISISLPTETVKSLADAVGASMPPNFKIAAVPASSTSTAAPTTSAEAPTTTVQASDASSAPADATVKAEVKSESFFDRRNVPTGPEAFLYSLQTSAPDDQQTGSLGPTASLAANAQISGQNAFDVGGISLADLVESSNEASKAMAGSADEMSAATIAQSSWEALMTSNGWPTQQSTNKDSQESITIPLRKGGGVKVELPKVELPKPAPTSLTVATPLFMQALGSDLSWLMSPGVQQLIDTFAPQPGDGGSYFAGDSSSLSAPTMSNNESSDASTAPTTTPSHSTRTVSSTTQSADAGSSTAAAADGTSESLGKSPARSTAQALEKALADPKNPFYVPPTLFRSCYSIPHWNLPPVTRLSMLALHAQQNLLKHVPLIHEPTFRLDTTPGCLSFAMCMLGCHQHGRMWWIGQEAVSREAPPPPSNGSPLDAKSAEEGERNLERARAQVLPSSTGSNAPRFDEEDGQILVQPIVMAERTDVLMQSFNSRARNEKDKASVVQALILFQMTRFLSADASVRAMAATVHPTVVTMARQAGLFDRHSKHCDRQVSYSGDEVMRSTICEAGDLCFSFSFLPSFLPGMSDEEKIWRRWSEMAGRRRTTFSIFVMDLVAKLDAGIQAEVGLDEVDHLPLPSPDTIWRAPTVKAWRTALERYKGPTMQQAMIGLLSDDESRFRLNDNSAEAAPSVRGSHGPFARLVLIVTLLRGVLALTTADDTGSSVNHPLRAYMEIDASQHLTHAQLVARLHRALLRWRTAWQEDTLCLAASGPEGRQKAQALGLIEPMDETTNGTDHRLFGSQTASGATSLMEDALPFFWLAYALLDRDASRTTVSSGLADATLATAASAFAQLQTRRDSSKVQNDGQTDMSHLLCLAKMFVNDGERAVTTV